MPTDPWEDWLASEEGKRCTDYPTLTDAQFLWNRLWWAFRAGQAATQKSSGFANGERESLQRYIRLLEERSDRETIKECMKLRDAHNG